jgi:hypothetical protein
MVEQKTISLFEVAKAVSNSCTLGATVEDALRVIENPEFQKIQAEINRLAQKPNLTKDESERLEILLDKYNEIKEQNGHKATLAGVFHWVGTN